MAIQNPHTDDPVLGEAWEEGYLAGYAQPEVDHLRPFAPNILDVYLEGEMAGRDERRLLPPSEGGDGNSDLPLVAVEQGLHVLGHKFFEDIFGRFGGLIPLVITALQIPTDSPMRPMDDDWTGPADKPDDQFIAVCPRDDHGPAVGATPDGYWTGPARTSYADAFVDMRQHGHDEAAVARCSVPDGECGLVWPGPG
jgi:hypothetical protein